MITPTKNGPAGPTREPGFKDAEVLLAPVDLESYWQFASRYVQNLHTPKGVPNAAVNKFDALCVAVHEVDHRPQSPIKIVGVPRTIKRLSVNELQKAVGRLRGRLFANARAAEFLDMVFGQWVKWEKNKTLLAVLDAVGCDHDEVGDLVGNVPDIADEAALTAVMPLLSDSTAYDVIVVCAGLAVNNPRWAPLWAAIPTLQQATVKQTPLVTASEVDEVMLTSSHADKPSDETPLADVASLSVQLDQLQELLNAAVGSISRGECPSPLDALEVWRGAEATLHALSSRFETSTRSLQELRQAEIDIASIAQDIAVLERILGLRHVSDPTYRAHDDAVAHAREAIGLLRSGRYSVAAPLLPPLRSLLTLIAQADTLDEVAALALDQSIRSAYGPTLALSAFRGRLVADALSTSGGVEPTSTAQVAQSFIPDAEPALPAVGRATDAIPPTRGEEAVSAGDTVYGPCPTAVEALAAEAPGTPSVQTHALVGASTPIEALQPAHPAVSIEVFESGRDNAVAAELPLQLVNRQGESAPAEPAAQSAEPIQPVSAQNTSQLETAAAGSVFDDSVQQFRALNWIDSRGRVVQAPWVQSQFYATVAEVAEAAWLEGNLGYGYFMADVAAGHGAETRFDLEDLRAADRLLEHPGEVALLRDEARRTRLRAALDADGFERGFAAIGLVLESVAPTFPQAWSQDEVAHLASRAQFATAGLETIVSFLLNGWAAATDPLALIKQELQRKQVSPDELAKAYEDAKSGLQKVVATLWNAAGGRIVHTHSKRAWTTFVEKHVAPLRDELAPRREKQKTVPTTVAVARQKVADLARAFTEIMHDQSVKHQDRTAAVTAADQVVAAIERVVTTKQQLEQQGRKQAASFGVVPTVEAAQLLTQLPTNPKDRLCVLLLRAAINGQEQRNALRVPTGHLRQAPDIARTLHPAVLAAEGIVDGIAVSEFRYRSAAAALLLGATADAFNFASRADLFEHLRNYGIETNRFELLSALVPANGLQSHEVTQLHRRALELGDKAYETARRLERAWTACDELIEPQAPRFKRLVDEAFLHCATAGGETPIGESILLQAWLDKAVHLVESARDSIAAIRVQQARASLGSLCEQFEAFVVANDYRSAMALLHPGELAQEGLDEAPRRTMWRDDAVKHYRQPRVTLIQELKGVPGVQSLIGWWAQPGENDPTYRDSLRKGLYDLVSGESGHTQAEVRKRFAMKLADLREHKDRKTVVRCAAIREYFRSASLNPTFLPQLADIDQIVLTSLSLPVSGGLPLDSYIRAASAEGTRSLTVFLEPNVSLSRRDEIVAGLRRRSVRAAVLDDVDICRLCAIGADAEGQNFIPLLEVIFEQLDLDLVSPFSTQDGQHIRLESFIGRAASAERIAEGWDYSRLFSGRKLGKSAFLRNVASTYDGYKLANSKTLHVIFITIAGGSSESWIVDTIIQEMSRRFNLPQEMESSMLSDPVDRFVRYATRFAKARSNLNVLVILDEADSFIEEQLARYDEVREKSLSFCMMKRMPAPEGSDEMPRLRFLFSGYRVTNTRGGVWANAGDVLILQPLTELEAVRFLRGMLGRIGVDIGNHAPFAARRCGLQPAVLIRFGESLLKRIKRVSRSTSRETYVVSHDDVVATMAEQAVLEEIRTVVNNNFQGNRMAAAIFGATLLALKDLQPGMALEGGPQEVLQKLAVIDEDLNWLAAMGASPVAQIERQLQEFIDRELLATSDAPRFGSREYRLKFPHFLSVLTQQTDVALQVRQHIQSLREGASPSRIVESVLSDASLDAVRYAFRESSIAECSVVVVAGHWPKALLDHKVGVPDRLGCSPSAVARVVAAFPVAERVASGYRVFAEVGEPVWRAMLATRLPRPVVAVGGVDLLRLGLKHLLEGVEVSIDVHPFTALPKAAIRWWFESARALHFHADARLDEIHAVTSGVPILVGALDAALTNAPATDVSAAQLQQAFSDVEEGIPSLARALTSGSPSERLTDRELELLAMAVRVAREFGEEFDLEKDFAEAWEMLCDDGEFVTPLKDERDRLSLQVLLGVGLLPATALGAIRGAGDLGQVRFDRNSLLFTLLTALEQSREG